MDYAANIVSAYPKDQSRVYTSLNIQANIFVIYCEEALGETYENMFHSNIRNVDRYIKRGNFIDKRGGIVLTREGELY